jgi:hypothetical protein
VSCLKDMFARLKPEERSAVFVLVALHVPTEVSGPDVSTWPNLWSYKLLKELTSELGLSQTMVDAHVPMLITGIPFREMDWNQRAEFSVPYISDIEGAGVMIEELYAMLLIFFIEREMMDGRGIVLMRNLTRTLTMMRQDALWLQNLSVNYLITEQQEMSSQAHEQKVDKYRYAKVGAVAAGAGALIAFTAGLVSHPAFSCSLFCSQPYLNSGL